MNPTATFLAELVTRARAEYLSHYKRLRNIIEDKTLADGLIDQSEEFGIDHTLTRMCEYPRGLGLDRDSPLLSRSTQKALAHILDSVLASQMRHDQAVKRREDYARLSDPGRLPVHVINGREVAVDYANSRVIYLDGEPPQILQVSRGGEKKERRQTRGR